MRTSGNVLSLKKQVSQKQKKWKMGQGILEKRWWYKISKDMSIDVMVNHILRRLFQKYTPSRQLRRQQQHLVTDRQPQYRDAGYKRDVTNI